MLLRILCGSLILTLLSISDFTLGQAVQGYNYGGEATRRATALYYFDFDDDELPSVFTVAGCSSAAEDSLRRLQLAIDANASHVNSKRPSATALASRDGYTTLIYCKPKKRSLTVVVSGPDATACDRMLDDVVSELKAHWPKKAHPK